MAGLVSEQTLESIRAASDIVEVIGSYFPLTKRAGANFVALCPFHREKTPSFNVNPQRQIFHCFGCHKGGDVFKFVQEYENLSFIEAVRRLAERARIPLDFEQTPGQEKTRFLKETLLSIHEAICQRWQAALANDAAGQGARDYLAGRGVPAEAVQLFRLGFAPEGWDDTVNWARSKGYELPTVEQGGLIIRKDAEDGSGSRYYDRFRGRLMFPICDEQGRVIAFSGRVLVKEQEQFGGKYINSPETPIFTKGKVCYGLDKSKRALLDRGHAVVCEGQLDLIACYMAGVQNVVAPQGTALTGDHCRVLKRYVNEVVLCFDSDTAGQNAATRALDDLLTSGLSIRVATVPAPHDPDSFIKEHGGEAFQHLISRAQGFFDYLLERSCREHDTRTDLGRTTIVRRMGESLLKTGDAVVVDTYASKTARLLGVSVEAVRAELRKAGRGAPTAAASTPASREPPRSSHNPEREFWLLRLLLLNHSMLSWAVGHLDLEWLEDQRVKRVLSALFMRFRSGSTVEVPELLAEVPEEGDRSLVTSAASPHREVPEQERQVKESVRYIRDAFILRRVAELSRRTSQPGISPQERDALVTETRRLRDLRCQPLSPLEPR